MVDTPIDTSSSSVMAQEMALCEAAEEQLRQSTAKHAAVFVNVSRRSEHVTQLLQQQVQQIEEAMQSAAAAYPVLAQDDALASRVEQHRVRRRTLLQHAALLELLELPNLMDACVRSSSSSSSATNTSNNDSFVFYEEALQIAAFANTLERRHVMDENRVIQDVIAQIRSRQAELRPLLLSRLRTTSTTMSECLEVVTALRRLNALELEQSSTGGDRNWEVAHADTERLLQIAFLEARDAWLDTTTGTTPESLLDAIERHRTRLFEVATQFNAIFRAQSTTTTNTSTSSQQQLLALWMARRVQSFLQFLRAALATKEAQDTAVIRDALEASVFFATSLGRLGADFTSLLAEPFEAAVVRVVTQPWRDGVAQLQETLTLCRDAGVAGPLTSADVVGSDESEYRGLPLEEPLPPPKQLLSLPPLARLVNAVLTGLNGLRRCLLPGIFPTLRHCLETQVLQAVEKELQRHERTVLTPGFAGETAALRVSAASLSTTFRDLVPQYLRGALEAAVGNAAAARTHHQRFLDQLASDRGLEGGEVEDDRVDENAANPNEEEDLVEPVEGDDDAKESSSDNPMTTAGGEHVDRTMEQVDEDEALVK
jgi:conserved oligomeric Golgi complex subunit 8